MSPFLMNSPFCRLLRIVAQHIVIAVLFLLVAMNMRLSVCRFLENGAVDLALPLVNEEKRQNASLPLQNEVDKNQSLPKVHYAFNSSSVDSNNANANANPSGVVVLGMHRSGTSMLAGLLATAAGYHVGSGDDMMGANAENQKGFFERFDVVRQNDAWLTMQNASWHSGWHEFDADEAWQRTSTDFGKVNMH